MRRYGPQLRSCGPYRQHEKNYIHKRSACGVCSQNGWDHKQKIKKNIVPGEMKTQRCTKRVQQRDGMSEFFLQLGGKHFTAELISFWWSHFYSAERSANFKGHAAVNLHC